MGISIATGFTLHYLRIPRSECLYVPREALVYRFTGVGLSIGSQLSVGAASKAGAVSISRFFFIFSIHLFCMTAMVCPLLAFSLP